MSTMGSVCPGDRDEDDGDGPGRQETIYEAVCGGPSITIDLAGDSFFFPEAGTLKSAEFSSGFSNHTDPQTMYYSGDEEDGSLSNPQVKGAPAGTDFKVTPNSTQIVFTPPPAPFSGTIVLRVVSFWGTMDDGTERGAAGYVKINVSCPGDGGGGDKKCTCETPGATLTVESGCNGWDDATVCSGWTSVIIGSEGGDFSPAEEKEAKERQVADGTVFCAFDCCIKLNCP